MAALLSDLREARRIGAHYALDYADGVGCLLAVSLVVGVLIAAAIGVAP